MVSPLAVSQRYYSFAGLLALHLVDFLSRMMLPLLHDLSFNKFWKLLVAPYLFFISMTLLAFIAGARRPCAIFLLYSIRLTVEVARSSSSLFLFR